MTIVAPSSAPNATVSLSIAQLPSLSSCSDCRGASAKRRSASSVRRKGSERKKSKSAANAPSLFLRTEWELAAKRRVKGTKRRIASGMNATKAMESTGERECSATPAAAIVTTAVSSRG